MAQEAVAGPGRGLRPAVRGWFARTFESMENQNLRILWIGTLLNFVGVTMNTTAQGVVAFDLTGNNRAVGTVLLGSGLAMLFVAPFAGALADRLSKRTMLITCQVILGSTFGFLGLAITAGFISVPMLAVSAFISSMMFAMIRSVRNAYIGELASPDQRGNAVAVQQLAMTVMAVLGPFLAGLLLGWKAVGSSGTYFVMAGAFVFAIATMLQLPATSAPAKTAASAGIVSETLTGLRYGWRHREIRWVLGGFFLLTVFGMPYMALLPGYTKDVLEVSTARLGVLFGISAVGGFAVSLWVASLADSPRALPVLALCNLTFGFALIGLGLAPNFAVAAFIALFVGAGSSGFQVLNLAVALRAADVAFMGRVAGLTMMAGSLSGIMAFPVGALADRYGERPLLVGMGCCVVVVAIFLATWRQRSRAQAAAA
ncbi:MAG: MFS transporter [Tepidiformaceae bacterium]